MPTGFQLDPLYSFTLLGAFAIYLSAWPAMASWVPTLLVAIALRAIFVEIVGGFGNYYGVAAISWGAFLGLAGLIALAGHALWGRKDRRAFCARAFYAAAVFPLLGLVVGYSVPLNAWLRPKTFDALLLAFDGALGFQPSFLLGRIVLKSPIAQAWTNVVYYALPFSSGLLYASYRLKPNRSVAILALLLGYTMIGFAQYGVYPAAGPAHAFPNFYPWNEAAVGHVVLQPMAGVRGPRNCMPSLHLGVALLVWWNSRIWPSGVASWLGFF